jgi:membrane-associated phospholipid phosphatase
MRNDGMSPINGPRGRNEMNTQIRTLVLAGLLTSCPFVIGAPARADEVTHWNQVATDVTAAAHADPLTESRLFAMLHVAMHDAVNRVEPRSERYLSASSDARGASAPAAAAVAAHDTLVALFPAGREAFDAALVESLRTAGGGVEAERGAAVGRAVAQAVLARRGADGSARTVAYTPGTKAGAYQPTPPDLTPAWAVQWGEVTPFVLRSPSQFRPGPPPAVDGESALGDIAVVRSIGAKDHSLRSDEQSEIARYWYENSTQGWNRIARTVAAGRSLDLHESARLFALLNLALADGYIAVFDAKYHYAYWRPVTAIRAKGEADWLSYMATPPIPDYPSGHTVEGAAAAAVLARFFGTDFVSFRMVSGDPYPGIERGFWSFAEAARENGASRVLAGIHFPTAVEAGYAQGTAVGAWVYDHALRPIGTERASARASR